MSTFFADDDTVTFGVQGSNVKEVAHWSSTLDDVWFRFFTNNGSEIDNLVTGAVIGSSNWDKSAAAKNDLYFGHVSSLSNVQRIMTIRENRVGVNTAAPRAALDVYGSNLAGNDIARFTYVNAQGLATPSLVINQAGEMGIGTEAVTGTALTIMGRLQATEFTLDPSALLVAQGMQPPLGTSFLQFADASFCNVKQILLKDSLITQSNVVASNLLVATNVRPVSGTTIQFSAATLSNVGNLTVNSGGVLSADRIQGSAQAGLVQFGGATLSNVQTLRVANLTTDLETDTINVSYKSLSNINVVEADRVRTAFLSGDPPDNLINATGTTLSNVGNLYVASTSALYANSINAMSGDDVSFNNKNITNVKDLFVAGDIKVRGEFFVLNTYTCNTNQLVIENDSTGPGLVVIQKGNQHVAQFQDDSNVVMFIKDGGQTAFGSFGTAINANIPASLVYIENPSALNQTALHVDQRNAAKDRLILQGPTCNVVVSGTGMLGLGTDSPTARIHAIHGAGDTTEFLRMTANNQPAFVVTADGKVGINTNVTASTAAALLVKGTVQNDEIVKTYGVQATTGTTLAFGNNTLSNITVIKAQQHQLTSQGTAATPAITFESDLNTGLFQPGDNELAIATNGVEALRVNASGNVGIGTDTAPVALYINKKDALRLPVGSTGDRPSGSNGYIRFNTDTSVFEGWAGGAWGSLGGVKDVNQDTYVSAEDGPGTNNDELKFYTSNVLRMYIGSTTEQGNVGIGTTIARTRLDIDSGMLRAAAVQIDTLTSTKDMIDVSRKTLSNIALLSKVTTVDLEFLTTTNATNSINVSGKSLSNIDTTRTTTLEVSNLTTTAAGGLINVRQNTLSNIALLSKVTTVDLEFLTTTNATNSINVSGKSLSNINTTRTTTLEVSQLTTTAAGGLINVRQNTLSNIALLSKVTTVDLEFLTTTNATNSINVSGKSLSNINTARATTLEVTNLNTTAAGNLINVGQNTLSNIALLSKVTTADLEFLTTTNATNSINVSGKSLSNIGTARATTLEVSNLTTTASGGLINVGQNTLSNIALLSKVTTVDLEFLTTTSTNNSINVSGKSLSNIGTARTTTLEVSNLTTTAAGNLINVRQNTLSNIALLSKVTTVDLEFLTTTNATNSINVSGKSLSNIGTARATTLEVTNLSTTASGGLINVRQNTLSNVNALDVANLTHTSGTIALGGTSLSNVGTLESDGIKANVIQPKTVGSNINLVQSTLSNIAALALVTKADIATLTNSQTNTISVDGKSLSNLASVVVNRVRVANIAGPENIHRINFEQNTLSNVGNVRIESGFKLATNDITSIDGGTDINFNNQNVRNINNLTVNGDIKIRGEFFVLNTTTCNTNQLVIENDSTGPALVVNQKGAQHVAQFQDDCNVVMFIKDGGQTAFGSFGPAINANIPSTLVYIENPSTSNQEALYVKQLNTNRNLLKLEGPSENITIDSTGHIGINVSAPQARMDVLSSDDKAFLSYSNLGVPSSTFQVSKDGRLGIGTAAPTTAHLYVNGTTQTDKVVTSSIDAATSSLIGFNGVSLSNIQTVSASTVRVAQIIGTGAGSAVNVSDSTLSNIQTVDAKALVINTITSTQNTVDVSNRTLSNIQTVKVGTVEVTTIASTQNNINVSARTLSNVAAIVTPSVMGTGVDKTVSFNFGRIVEVDRLVVRSNITVTMTGLDTYTNLPTDIVRLNETGKIPDQQIDGNVVRTAQDGKINAAFIPVVDTGRNMLLHTRDKVGIGLRNPQQKLHVHGNQVITSGRLGIGTTTPLHSFHVYDDSAGVSSLRIDTRGANDTLRASIKDYPVLYVTASCNVGIRTAGPAHPLHVVGKAYATDAVRTNALESDTGTIDCRLTSLSNVFTAHVRDLVVTNSMTGTASVTRVDTDTISALTQPSILVENALNVTGYSGTLYSSHTNLYGDNSTLTRIGIKVDESVLAKALLTASDRRIKGDVVESAAQEDLDALLSIPVRRFRFLDRPAEPATLGFIAQEVEEAAPFAVRTTHGPVPTVMRDVVLGDDRTILPLPAAHRGDVPITAGTLLKLLVPSGEASELVVRVATVTEQHIILEQPIDGGAASVFVYGPIVSDFKLLDTERLVPLTFNAIKQLWNTQGRILERLARLEALLKP
jgi:hypothetical protein